MTKLTAITELTVQPDAADLLYVADDPGGTPAEKRIKYENLVPFILIGEAVQGAAAEFLTLDFTLDATITALLVMFHGVELSTIDQLELQIKQGGSYTAAGYDYSLQTKSSSGSNNFNGSTADTGWKLTNDGATWGLPANKPCNGMLWIVGDVAGTAGKSVHGQSAHEAASGAHVTSEFGGEQLATTTAIEGVRLHHEGAGDVDAGTIRVFGIR